MGVAGYFGLREFTRAIYRQRDCEWANIDNIEMHAEVNIPRITNWDCLYDPATNIKRAFFIIDTAKVDIARYIHDNGFKKHTAATGFTLSGFLRNEHTPANLQYLGELYYKDGRYERETWKLLLDRQSGKLWVILNYMD